MVLGKLPVPGRPTIWMVLGQGLIALAVGSGGVLDIFTLLYPFSHLSPSLWETARYRLRYCLKGSLNPKQLTNQPNSVPNQTKKKKKKTATGKGFPKSCGRVRGPPYLGRSAFSGYNVGCKHSFYSILSHNL